MQARTIFLSKLLGLYSLIVGLAMLSTKQTCVATVTKLMNDAAALMLASVIAIGVGLALILTHNVWSGGAAPVVVTLAGWLSLLKGVVLLWLTPEAAPGYFAALHYEQLFYVYAGVTFALGAYLSWAGFTAKPR